MRGVVRRAAPPFLAVLNKFIFKGSRGEFVVLVPQGPENVLRPGLICRWQQIAKSTKFGFPWPTRSHPPAPPRPSPRAQDQVATLPLLGSFRCFELPFSRRGWPWCCIKFLFWGALEGDRLAALRRTGAARTRGWVIAGDRGSTGPPKKLTQTTVNSWTLLATNDAHTRAPSLVVPPRSKPMILTLLLLGFLRCLLPVCCRPYAGRTPCS